MIVLLSLRGLGRGEARTGFRSPSPLAAL